MITIRKARLKDTDVILSHWKKYTRPLDKIMKNDPGSRNFIFGRRKSELEDVRKYVNKNIRSPKYAVYVAEVDGKFAGFCTIGIRKIPPLFKIKHVDHMDDLYVNSDFRKMRIASMFKKECLKWAKEKGMKYISLLVFRGNKPARVIYDKWGFSDFNILMYKKI